MRIFAAALCLGLLVGVAEARTDFSELVGQTQKTLTETARAYLDPEIEFVHRPRKAFREALEDLRTDYDVDALADIPLLREIAYRGRHFLPRFSDKQWQRENEVTEHTQTDRLYFNLRFRGTRLTYALPHAYPAQRAFAKIQRPDPFPLLLAIHQEQDELDAEGGLERNPGAAVLRRCYPKGRFARLYARWLTLAPVATHASFLGEDGAIQHPVLTAILTDFWRRYHVDFDRIVVDGDGPAAALAAAFPHALAGLVLRPGRPIDPDLVVNYASVPVFVVGNSELARTLEQQGHRDVSDGGDAALLTWLNERRRRPVRHFNVRWKGPDHSHAQWVTVDQVDSGSSNVRLAVHTVDTEADPNTIRIATHGIEQVRVFLNDQIVDLDRPVRLIVNDEVRELGSAERSFARLFELDPAVRRSMNFGWLYTVLVEHVAVQPSGQPWESPFPVAARGTEADEDLAKRLWERGLAAEERGSRLLALKYFRKIVELGPTSYREAALMRLRQADAKIPAPPQADGTPDVPAPNLSLTDRLATQQEWLEGRPDRLEQHLGEAADATTAERLLPFALRDLWWRPAETMGLRLQCEEVLADADDVLGDQLRWVLAGGGAPYPTHANPAWDPWPLLTALVLDRQMRETTGAKWLPDESPVMRRRVLDAPEEWQDWYSRWCAWFYDDLMRTAYEGEAPERLPKAFVEADREQARLADDLRGRNAWLALLAGVLFVGGAFVLGRRVSRA